MHFPYYELYLTETGQILGSILSLLLFFRCVQRPEPFFQQICDGFDKRQLSGILANRC